MIFFKFNLINFKNRRKISETQPTASKSDAYTKESKQPQIRTDLKPLNQSINSTPSPPLVKIASADTVLFQKPVLLNASNNQIQKVEDKVDEWPDLNTEILQQKKSTNHQFVKIAKKPLSPKQPTQLKKEETLVKSVPWRVESKPVQNLPSLLDVMNDELKSLTLNSSPTISTKNNQQKATRPVLETVKTMPIEKSDEINASSNKTWNVQASPKVNSPLSSFANIIEMEKRSKDQYNRLKNRPLNLIQIEEKAIDDLKKFYDVENCFNMEYTIELVDDSGYNSLVAPFWQKN